MTPTGDDRTIIRPLTLRQLLVRDPSGATRQVPLPEGTFTIGRGEDNALALEASDQSASRHHARLQVAAQAVTIEDCGSTNGLFVNETRVASALLRPGDVVRLGRTELVLDPQDPVRAAAPQVAPAPSSRPEPAPPAKAGRPGRPSRRTLLYLAVLAVMLLLLGLAVFSGSDKPAPPPADQPAGAAQPEAKPQTAQTAAPAPQPEPAAATKDQPPTPSAPATDGPAGAKLPVSPEAAEKSLDHTRQGMFFFNTGKLRLALAEWEKALALDPGNAQAAKWLARAESERDQRMDTAYREGLTALKYARRDEARNAFRSVLEHCRDQADERCLDAARQLERLEGKKP